MREKQQRQRIVIDAVALLCLYSGSRKGDTWY